MEEPLLTPARPTYAKASAGSLLSQPLAGLPAEAALAAKAGGAEGNRTPDLCSAIAALSHLSYSPAPAKRLLSGANPAAQRRPPKVTKLLARCSSKPVVSGRQIGFAHTGSGQVGHCRAIPDALVTFVQFATRRTPARAEMRRAPMFANVRSDGSSSAVVIFAHFVIPNWVRDPPQVNRGNSPMSFAGL